MPLLKTCIIFFLSILLLSACKTTKKVSSKKANTKSNVSKKYTPSSRQAYIDRYSNLAIKEMLRTGIPASITLAQAVLESGNGNSTLARNSKNHFGIKCHSDWKGKTFTWDDDKKNECFRKYNSVEDSYRDHSDFLKNKSRYGFLFDLKPSDYKAWSKGLKKAGYATNPKYANLLIDIIEDNDLTVYDKGKVSKKKEKVAQASPTIVTPPPSSNAPVITATTSTITTSNNKTKKAQNKGVESTNYSELGSEDFVIHTLTTERQIKKINRVDYVVVRSGDTFKSLAEEFQLLKWEISKYNELDEDTNLESGQIIYLQAKRSQAEKGLMFHIAGDNETMWDIGQKYAIKTRKLYELNEMKSGQEPNPGQKLLLRESK